MMARKMAKYTSGNNLNRYPLKLALFGMSVMFFLKLIYLGVVKLDHLYLNLFPLLRHLSPVDNVL